MSCVEVQYPHTDTQLLKYTLQKLCQNLVNNPVFACLQICQTGYEQFTLVLVLGIIGKAHVLAMVVDRQRHVRHYLAGFINQKPSIILQLVTNEIDVSNGLHVHI